MGCRRWLFASALAVASCKSDGGISSDFVDWGVPNPIPLESRVNVDRITQTTIPSVDVMFVVDNSCSMSQEQVSLGANFPAMLDWFLGSGLDYHIGVISTDMNDPLHAGRLREVGGLRWLQEDSDAPEALFAQMVEMGTSGNAAEQGRASAWTAIEQLGGTDNLGFVREDAGMHITVVSDENDASTDSPVSRPEFVDYLRDLRWSARMVSFSSIVGPLTGCPYIGSPGTEYTAITNAVGGVTWPICSDDWTEVLDELGFVAVGLSREFFLSQLPVADTIEVRVEEDGTVREFFPSDWTWSESRNSISFTEFVPNPLSIVEIEYEIFASTSEIEDVTPPE